MRILSNGKVAVIAVAGDDNYPYAVPVNYVYYEGNIFLHSAMYGHKIDALRRCTKCSVCIVDKDDIIPEQFTSYFRSVIAFGEAEIIEDSNEKMKILNLLSEKYCKGIDPTTEINKFLNVVAVIRIKVEKVTGKEAIELVRQH